MLEFTERQSRLKNMACRLEDDVFTKTMWETKFSWHLTQQLHCVSHVVFISCLNWLIWLEITGSVLRENISAGSDLEELETWRSWRKNLALTSQSANPNFKTAVSFTKLECTLSVEGKSDNTPILSLQKWLASDPLIATTVSLRFSHCRKG